MEKITEVCNSIRFVKTQQEFDRTTKIVANEINRYSKENGIDYTLRYNIILFNYLKILIGKDNIIDIGENSEDLFIKNYYDSLILLKDKDIPEHAREFFEHNIDYNLQLHFYRYGLHYTSFFFYLTTSSKKLYMEALTVQFKNMISINKRSQIKESRVLSEIYLTITAFDKGWSEFNFFGNDSFHNTGVKLFMNSLIRRCESEKDKDIGNDVLEYKNKFEHFLYTTNLILLNNTSDIKFTELEDTVKYTVIHQIRDTYYSACHDLYKLEYDKGFEEIEFIPSYNKKVDYDYLIVKLNSVFEKVAFIVTKGLGVIKIDDNKIKILHCIESINKYNGDQFDRESLTALKIIFKFYQKLRFKSDSKLEYFGNFYKSRNATMHRINQMEMNSAQVLFPFFLIKDLYLITLKLFEVTS